MKDGFVRDERGEFDPLGQGAAKLRDLEAKGHTGPGGQITGKFS